MERTWVKINYTLRTYRREEDIRVELCQVALKDCIMSSCILGWGRTPER